jgi:hypothetical protein
VPSPTGSHQLYSRTGGYASAGPTSAAVGRAFGRPVTQYNSTKQDSTNLGTLGTRKAAAGPAKAGPQGAQFATSHFEVGLVDSSPLGGNTAARSAHRNQAKAASSCHAEHDDTVSCPQRSSSPRPRTSCSKHTAAGAAGTATPAGQLTASSPAAASSPAHARKQASQAGLGSPAASPAVMARSPYKGSVSLSWSAELASPGGAAAPGQDLAYLHAEEVGGSQICHSDCRSRYRCTQNEPALALNHPNCANEGAS